MLESDGYVHLPDRIPVGALEPLRQLAGEALKRPAAVPGCDRHAAHGSSVTLDYRDPRLVAAIVAPAIGGALTGLGLSELRWLSAYLVVKPPGATGLWWHQDWWAWTRGTPRTPVSPQVFVMVYLDRTTPANGCLRVVPGSHRNRHPLHALLPPAHGSRIEELPAAHPAHATHPDERDVPVEPGDLVVGDARLLHATHPNTSPVPRRCLLLWYLHGYDRLAPAFQQHYRQHPCQPPLTASGTDAPAAELRPWLVSYSGPPVEPVPFNRTPFWGLSTGS